MTKIATTTISCGGEILGWKVYLDGKKYPKKPRERYACFSELTAIRRAFQDAGKDSAELVDLVME